MTDIVQDDPPFDRDARRPKRWPAFLAGLLLGAGITVGVFLALDKNRTLFATPMGNQAGSKNELRFSDSPAESEVLDYLDGKSFALPTKDVKEQPKNILIKRENLTDLKWHSASQQTGDANPWHHTYSCLYASDDGVYILDVWISTRVVGRRRAFLELKFEKVTPVEKVVTPKTN